MVQKVNIAQIDEFPTSLTGEGTKFVAVKADETGFEFLAVAPGGGVTTFAGLSDTPGSLGTAGQMLQVNAGATALEFVNQPTIPDVPQSFPGNFDDFPSTYTGAGGYLMRIEVGEGAIEFVDPDTLTWDLDQVNGLPDPSGQGTKLLRVNAGGTAYEAVDQATAIDPSLIALHDLDEMPTFQAGKYLRAKSDGSTDLEYVSAPTGGATTFTGLSDTPNTLVSEGLKFLRVNATANAIEFVSAPKDPIMFVAKPGTVSVEPSAGTFRMPQAMTISDIKASVSTAPSGGAMTVDVNRNGVSILSTVISIDNGDKTSRDAAVAPALITEAVVLSEDDEITIDVDSVNGSPRDLIVYLIP